jgi:8-oxo-dGTP pyrophosphatase MutT (NUDIX family)
MVLNNVYFAQKCVIYNIITKKILILQRSDYKPESTGMWDFVGGSYDYGTESKEELKREGVEELMVELLDIKTIDYYAKPADKKDSTFIFGLSFCDNYVFETGVPELSDEHTGFRWVSVDDLDNYEFVNSVEECKKVIKPFIERFYNIIL